MTPRRASLRVAHQKACPNAGKTTIASLRGCKCKPSYYTFHRGRDGRPVKGPRVRNREEADRALRKLQVEIDEGRLGTGKPKDVSFSEWAEKFLEIIGGANRKASTVAAYRPTIRYCENLFGDMPLREIGSDQFRDLVAAIRKEKNGRKGSDATVSKHLRHLGAILQRAADETPRPLIAQNPIPKFKKSLSLNVVGGVEPLTDEELARLWASMAALKTEDVYVAICKASVTTGARQGELIAANLGDLDLLNGVLRIGHHYDRATGERTATKTNKARDIQLIPPARSLFEDWLAKHGDRGDDEPIFVAPRSGGRINGQYLTRVVETAMEKAKPEISRVGKDGRPRKPFHAFRSTFDRILREQGRNPDWIRSQLGHSDLKLTLDTYGEWSDAAKHAEAAKVEAEAFPI